MNMKERKRKDTKLNTLKMVSTGHTHTHKQISTAVTGTPPPSAPLIPLSLSQSLSLFLFLSLCLIHSEEDPFSGQIPSLIKNAKSSPLSGAANAREESCAELSCSPLLQAASLSFPLSLFHSISLSLCVSISFPLSLSLSLFQIDDQKAGGTIPGPN